jgi:phage-related protein
MSLTEIIVNLIDNVSSNLEGIANTAQTSFDSVENSAGDASSTVEGMGGAADTSAAALDSISGEGIEEISGAADTSSSALETVSSSAESAEGSIDGISNSAISAGDSINGVGNDASNASNNLQELGNSGGEAGGNIEDGFIGATIALGTLTAGMEIAAQNINDTSIEVGRLSTESGMAEPALRDMVAHITNATFPTDEAILYTRTLNQMGVESKFFAKSATDLDILNDATGVGADNINKLTSSFKVMGVDLTNIPSSYNAIAYAQANVTGGTEAYIGWMTKYDATFKEMGLNIDQTAVIIAASTKKFGGGRAAYTGLNEAIKDSNGNLEELEKTLGMQPGSLQNAEQATAAYAGKINEAAAEEAEHKTVIDQARAALDDITMQYGDTLSMVSSVGGAMAGLSTIVTGLASAKILLAGSTAGETGAMVANTTATNAGLLSKIKSKIASGANILLNYGSATSLSVATGAAMAHAGAVNTATAATNTGFLSKLKDNAATVLGSAVTAVKTGATMAASAAQWALNAAMSANPIGIIIILILALVGVLIYVWQNNEGFRESIMGLWDALVSFLQPAITAIQEGWNRLMGIISPLLAALGRLWDAIMVVAGAWLDDKSAEAGDIWTTLQGVFAAVGDVLIWVGSLIIEHFTPAFEQLWEILSVGAEIAGSLFGAVWETIIGILGAVMGHFTRVIDIITQLVEGNITAGEALGQIWDSVKLMFAEILFAIIKNLGKWAADMWNKAVNAGKGFVNNLINNIKSLPGKFWNWLVSTANYVLNFARSIRQRAIDAGIKFLEGLLSQIKQAPGKVYNELLKIGGKITEIGGQLWQKAQGLGKKILDGFLGALGIKSPGFMYYRFTEEVSRLEDTLLNNGVGDAAAQMGEGIKNNIGNLEMSANISADTPTIDPNSATVTQFYDTDALQAQSNTTQGILTTVSSFTDTTFKGMEKTMTSTIRTMGEENRKGYQAISTVTRTTLAAIRTGTTKEINTVERSWDGMKSALIGSAKTIDSQVTSKIRNLSSNMATFWGRIRNPARLLSSGGYAGPSPDMPNINISGGGGGYAGPSPDTQILEDMPEGACNDPYNCFAGWDYDAPWIKQAMGKVNNWIPQFEGLGQTLKVGDFTNSTMPLKANAQWFAKWIQGVIGKTKYKFYFNSGYGSPAAALRNGNFNCWDGMQIVRGLASKFGLSNSMQRGFWGSTRHVWSKVGGIDIDTTAIQAGHGLMSPRVRSAGPADLIEAPGSNTKEIKILEEMDLNLNINLENLPENINEASLVELLKKVITDSELIKILVKDRGFMNRLNLEVERISKREGRAVGGMG